MKVSYGVPQGFDASDMDNDARYLGQFNGVTLPDYITFSSKDSRLVFSEEKYRSNGIKQSDIDLLEKVLHAVDYKQCINGCDMTLSGYRVSIDKVKRTIAIQDSEDDYLIPETHFGLIHNQSVDLRASSDRYRSMNINGEAWLGLPRQSFGYLSWFADQTQTKDETTQVKGISSWYMQKNFSRLYLRAGKQNSIDYTSGAISSLLTPSFEHFITVGRQIHLLSTPDTGSLVLYSTAEGNYEFYRDGRLILKRPAVLGRNEIAFADLPGGYYSVEVRLVDRNGRVIKREVRDVNAVSFGNGQNAWSLTAGREMRSRLQMMQVSWSQDMRWFFMNTSTIVGRYKKWAAELNVTRPMMMGLIQFMPTLGLLAGEKKSGGYASVTVNSEKLGSLSVSRYQNNRISHFYEGSASTTLNYSYILKGMTLSYRYQRYSSSEQQQIETRWNYRPNGLWATFALGLQKGGYQLSGGNYGVYLNTTWTLNNSQSTFSAARSGNQTQLSADYRKDFDDDYGQSTLGTSIGHIADSTSVNMYASRSGTRGDASINVGHSDNTTNADINYRGMFAANTDGIAFGRYSYGGAAILLKTPEIKDTPYGFTVEGAPVAGNSLYAVPLETYKDVSFASVLTNSRDTDMSVEVPVNIVRAHPGQVYSAKASVDLNMLYSGFMKDVQGKPISGVISQTGDIVFPNGLFSIASKKMLSEVTVDGKQGVFRCDLRKPENNRYPCVAL